MITIQLAKFSQQSKCYLGSRLFTIHQNYIYIYMRCKCKISILNKMHWPKWCYNKLLHTKMSWTVGKCKRNYYKLQGKYPFDKIIKRNENIEYNRDNVDRIIMVSQYFILYAAVFPKQDLEDPFFPNLLHVQSIKSLIFVQSYILLCKFEYVLVLALIATRR